MSSTANCPTRASRSFPAMKSSAGSIDRPRRRGASTSASASAFPGSAIPADVCPYCVGGHENLCDHPAIHRLHARRRLCDRDRSPTRASPFRSARSASDVGARALALRRADRLARRSRSRASAATNGSGSMASAPPRISWRRSPVGRAAGVRIHPAGRCRRRRISPEASAPSGPAARTRRRRNRSTPRSSSPPSARWCPLALRAVRKGGARRLRRHSHERHSELSLCAPVGGAPARLGRQSHPPRRRRIPAPRAATRHEDDDQDLSARRTPMRRLPICAPAPSTARPCSFPETE